MWGLIIVGSVVGGWLMSKAASPQRNAAQQNVKAGDNVMVNTAGLGLPRAMDENGNMVSPPELIPVTVYGTNQNILYGRVDTQNPGRYGHSSAVQHYWDGTDVAFDRSAVAAV